MDRKHISYTTIQIIRRNREEKNIGAKDVKYLTVEGHSNK
jgi:hypothetical protein